MEGVRLCPHLSKLCIAGYGVYGHYKSHILTTIKGVLGEKHCRTSWPKILQGILTTIKGMNVETLGFFYVMTKRVV